MDCILNEVSIFLQPNKQTANSMIARFVRAAIKAQEGGFGRIRLSESIGRNLYNLMLSPNYSVSQWLNDPTVDTEIRERFRLIVANPPLFNVQEIAEQAEFEYSEFFVKIKNSLTQAYGLGVAYLTGNLAFSLLSDEFWNEPVISLLRKYLDIDVNEQTENVTVLHFSKDEHLSIHQEWLNQKQRDGLRKSSALWERREEFFPNLILCGQVETQLQRIGFSKYFDQIIERLRTLDGFAANWSHGDFNYREVTRITNLNISPESEQTIRKFSGERRFKLPDGRRVLHELHIKTGNLRFHFYPDNQSNKIYIGYIGTHLNTSSGE